MLALRRHPRWRAAATVAGVLGAAVVGAALAWLWGTLQPPVFAASATLQVSGAADPARPYDSLRADAKLASVLAAITVIPSRLATAADRAGLPPDRTGGAGLASARNVPGTPFITITAYADDPAAAASVANALAQIAVASAEQGPGLGAGLVVVEPASPPDNPAYTRLGRDMATGALVAALAVAAGLPRRRRPAAPSQASLPIRGRPIAAGLALATVVVLLTGIGAPEQLMQGLMIAAALLAVAFPSAGLALLAVTLPLREPVGFGPIGVNLLVIGGVAYGTLLRIVLDRDPPSGGRRTIAVAGFIGLAIIGSTPALNGLQGDAATGPIASLLQIAAGLTLVVCAAYHFAREDYRPYLFVTVLTATFAAALALAQFVASDIATLPLSGVFAPSAVVNPARPSGPFENTNYFGLYMALGLIAALGTWITLPRLRLITAGSLVIIGLALTVGTLSRGALLAVMAGVLVLLWLLSHRRVALAGSVALLALVFLVLPVAVEARFTRSGTGSVATAVAGVTESDQQRLKAVMAAFPLYQIDPLFGIGFGQYSAASPRFLGSSPVTASHSQYLDSLAEQGLVGVAALAALVWAAISSLRRGRSTLASVAAAMLATYLVASLFLEPLASLQTSGALWLILGAGIASSAAAESRASPEGMRDGAAPATWIAGGVA